MKRNFEFDFVTVVKWGEDVLDLHNDYDLKSFGTALDGTEARLSFARNEHAFAAARLPEKVTLDCKGNVKVAFNDLTALVAPANDEGIEIAYFHDGCDWLSFLSEDLARLSEPLGLDVRFINGLVVRIYCDEATLTAV
ncbi:MAG: hypothetical protein ACK4Z5_00530 [Brevundimonas sp.]